MPYEAFTPVRVPTEPRSPPEEAGDPVATAVEALAMQRAIELAARGLGSTSPNPVV
ncbi:riboflavin biosynthesis protein RibD, partial [Streptomyces rubrisoli]|nr:riboflavin biosynthesis protein RibD [Streptantibioticus rubrisoli]